MTHGDDPLPAGLDETLRTIAAELPALRREVTDLREKEVTPLREKDVPDLRKREGRLTFWLAVAFAVLTLLAVAVGVLLYVAARQNSDRIAAEARDQYQACLAANRFRAEDLATWKKVLPVVLPSAPQWQAKGVAILAAERAKDAPRDCARLPAAHSR